MCSFTCFTGSQNFLKLCKTKYYNFCLFHSVQVSKMLTVSTVLCTHTYHVNNLFIIVYIVTLFMHNVSTKMTSVRKCGACRVNSTLIRKFVLAGS